MRDLILLFSFLAFFGMGVFNPFILGLGYVWVDIFSPQRIDYSLLSGISISYLIAIATFAAYLLLDRKNPPRFNIVFVFLALFAGWITLTLHWAVSPGAAEVKWGWAIKVVCFTIFVPYLFRTRVQIEALLLTILFSVGGTLLSFGIKTAISGGGYGVYLGLYSSNLGLGEGSTVALTAVSIIPLLLYFADNSQILPRILFSRLMMYGFSAVAVLTAIGTTSRTGLVSLCVLMTLRWFGSSRKFIHLIGLILLTGTATFFVDQSWQYRMSTIKDYEMESSNAGRIAVWKWTIKFVSENPHGGGFDAYRINEIEIPHPLNPDHTIKMKGRAFHSSYFEVLGEHGFIGLAVFGCLIFLTIRFLNQSSSDPPKSEEGVWIAGLASATRQSLLVYLVGSFFIGIAFQPFMYYLIATAICLRELAWRGHRSVAGSDDDAAHGRLLPGQLDRWGRSSSHPPLDRQS